MSINQSLSLTIPRVFPQWVDEQTIVDIFHKQHLGLVYKVSIVRMPDSKKRSYPIYKAYIYFTAWYDNEIAYNFQQRIFGPKKQARIVYDDPWFWVAFENKQHRLSNNDKRIIRLGRKSVNAWQKLDQLHDTLTECEELMREIKETTEKQKRMLAEFHQESAAGPMQLTVDDVQQCINEFLDEEALNDVTMTEPVVNKTHSMSVRECIDEFLDIEMVNAEKSEAPQNIISWTQQNLEAAATAMLGDELNLTETAFNVAEAALADNEYDDDERSAEAQQEEYIENKLRTNMDLDYPGDDYYSDYYDEPCEREEDYDY